MSDVALRLGGHNQEQAFFSSPRQPEWTVFADGRAILFDDALGNDPYLGPQAAAARKKLGKVSPALLLFASLGVLLAVVIGSLFAFKGSLSRMAANRIPAAWEEALGQALFESIKASGNIIEDSEANELLKDLTGPLVSAAPAETPPLKFFILSETNINAFAMPGGYIVIHTGLILAADSPEEVAGVLAHEIAHVTRRHSMRNMIESAGLSLIARALLGDGTGLLALITDNSQMLLRQKFSRDFEREADDFGWELLERAQIDPRGLIRFFGRLEAAQAPASGGRAAGGGLGLLSSHPATRERISRLEERAKQLPDSRPRMEVNFVSLQARIGTFSGR